MMDAALCSMLCALCSVLYALCSMLYAYMVIQTNGCSINEYITNSQIVHCESTTPGGPYHLAP
eukprot:COSAG06_NODE_1495_length_9262_cov_21.163779_1_plen_62_part_10